jgi:hypothetical protein
MMRHTDKQILQKIYDAKLPDLIYTKHLQYITWGDEEPPPPIIEIHTRYGAVMRLETVE